MSFSNITALNLGNTITTSFSEGIRQNLSVDYPEFELVQSIKASTGASREFKYLMQTSLGPSAVQYRKPGTRYAFPAGQQSSQVEATAYCKELLTTVEFEYNLFKRLLETKDKYTADRLKMEIESKNVVTRRQICIDFYGDGSGVLATISSVTVANGVATVTCASSSTSRGFSGNCQFDEKVIHKVAAGTAGTAPSVASGTFDHWKVIDRNTHKNANTVKLRAYDANDNALTVNSWAPAAGELIYKHDQPTFPDLSGPVADYGTLTEVITGLRSLISNDGRVVNGLTMEGALGAQVVDWNGAQLDVDPIEDVMNRLKNAVGKAGYKWPKACMNRYVRSSFIEGRETDLRFLSSADNERGTAKMYYIHEDDKIELYGTELCPYQDIFVLPENKVDGHKVIEYHGMDFSTVAAPGESPWRLAPSGNGFMNLMLMYLFGGGQLVSNRPSATGRITNFTA